MRKWERGKKREKERGIRGSWRKGDRKREHERVGETELGGTDI